MSNEVKVIHPYNVGWLELKLTTTEVDFLWKRIEERSEKSVKNYLAGNIKESKAITDKDNVFFNNTLLPLCKMYAENFENIGSRSPVNNQHPYFLESMWVNYQQKYEFNPVHDHLGVYSFVVWMMIPTKHSEQHQIPIASKALSPHLSNFEFLYTDILGKPRSHVYKMDPELEGTMLFFPSSLNHLVYPFFNCDGERISISGNISINTSVIL